MSQRRKRPLFPSTTTPEGGASTEIKGTEEWTEEAAAAEEEEESFRSSGAGRPKRCIIQKYPLP